MALTKITTSLVAVNSLTSANIADNSIDATKIANNQILARHIAAGPISDQLAAAQPTITSLGTLTALTVDNINVNGNTIKSTDSDGDLIFQGNDGGSTITALTLDMSDAGTATFNHDVVVGGNISLGDASGATITMNDTDGSEQDFAFVLGANALAMRKTSNSNDIMRLDLTNERVGIGTSSPDCLVEIAGAHASGIGMLNLDSTDHAFITLDAASSSHDKGIYFKEAGTEQVIIDHDGSANQLRIHNGSTSHMVITDAGKVGIGTTSPSSKLQIMGGTSGLDQISLSSNLNDNSTKYAGIVMTMYTNNTAAIIGAYGANSDTTIIYGSSGTDHRGPQNHVWYTNTNYNSTSGNTERMRIKSDGAVVVNNAGGDAQIYLGGSSGTSRMYLARSGSDALLWNVSNGNLRFGANNSEGMRLNSSGLVGIGTTSPTANLHVSAGNPNNTSDAIFFVSKTGANDFTAKFGAGADDYGLHIRGAGNYAWSVFDHSNDVYRARITFGGQLLLTDTTIASISDRRLKENIVDANSQWNDIKALKWRNFKWKEESKTGTYFGLIADEVESISPNLVQIDAQPKEDIDAGIEDPEYKTVKYSIVWMKAMKALQEAQERIETLEAKVQALEG